MWTPFLFGTLVEGGMLPFVIKTFLLGFIQHLIISHRCSPRLHDFIHIRLDLVYTYVVVFTSRTYQCLQTFCQIRPRLSLLYISEHARLLILDA